MITGAEWNVSADWKKSVHVAFCVTAEGANPHCYGQEWNYFQNSYSNGFGMGANFAARPEKIDDAFFTAEKWSTPTMGLSEGAGIFTVEATAGNPRADPVEAFGSIGYFAQVKESVSTAKYFRFSPGPITIHAWNSAASNQWETAEYELTGAASLVAGLSMAVATLLF